MRGKEFEFFKNKKDTIPSTIKILESITRSSHRNISSFVRNVYISNTFLAEAYE